MMKDEDTEEGLVMADLVCTSCGGNGWVNGFRSPGGFGRITCFACNGTGMVDRGYRLRRHRGMNIRDARVILGLTLRQMATALKVNVTQASGIELGQSTDAELERAEAWIRESTPASDEDDEREINRDVGDR